MCANFLTPERSVTLGEIAGWVGGQLVKGGDDFIVCGAGTLDDADGDQITFLDNPRYSQALPKSRAGACLVREKNLGLLPAHMHPCVVDSPYIAWADILTRLYPQSDNLSGIAPSISDKAVISESAKLEPGCIIEPGVVIGKDVQIGSGSRIGANTVICQNVCIGRNCYIGPNCTIQYALIGDFVAIHPGVCVGQDGFGFAQGPKGHRKVPQIGRVIVQDHVEIGANTTIDRGAVNDTIIGEGTKIDNQVQIGHNVVIGCHCLIVAQVGIAGSTRLGDFVAIGGQAGIKGHCHIGSYAQIGASSGVGGNIAKGARYGGYPARPLDQWLKQIKWLNRQISGK